MNRGRRRNAKPGAERVDRGDLAPIDLGIALSVYSKDKAGKLVEIHAGDTREPCWYGFLADDAPPTEH